MAQGQEEGMEEDEVLQDQLQRQQLRQYINSGLYKLNTDLPCMWPK